MYQRAVPKSWDWENRNLTLFCIESIMIFKKYPTIYLAAQGLGFSMKDLFIVVGGT